MYVKRVAIICVTTSISAPRPQTMATWQDTTSTPQTSASSKSPLSTSQMNPGQERVENGRYRLLKLTDAL